MTEDHQHEFSIHEYDALREEILENIKYVRRIETYAVLATAAVDSFLFSLERPSVGSVFHVPVLAWAIPALFPVLALKRISDMNKQTSLIGSYVRELELKYNRIPKGWESYLETRVPHKQNMVASSNMIVTVSLILFSLCILSWRLWRTLG